MFQYAVTRSVAERNGYEFGFNRTPSHDYLNGQEQMDFMDIDYGIEHNTPFGQLPDGITNVWYEKYDTMGNCDYHAFQPDIFDVPDNTKLVIRSCQDARYLDREKCRKWFQYKQDVLADYFHAATTLNLFSESVCIINIRGGAEYKSQPNVLLPEKYYRDAMKYFPSRTKFIVMTDDISYGKDLLGLETYHFSIGGDYYILNNSRKLILSNTSFAILPVWLSNHNPYVVAPKYWSRYNTSNGQWCNSDIWTFRFNFLGRDGVLDENI